MIHALADSISPVRMAFGEIFAQAEVVNLLDVGMLIGFEYQTTPAKWHCQSHH